MPLLFSRLPMFPFFDLAHYVASVMALKEQRGERRRLAGRDGATPLRVPVSSSRVSPVPPPCLPPCSPMSPPPGPPSPGRARPEAGGWGAPCRRPPQSRLGKGGRRARWRGVPGGSQGAGSGGPAGAGLSRRVPGGARRDLPLPGFCRWVSAGAASVSPGVGVLERLRGLLPRGPSSLQKARECWGVFFTTFGFYLFLMTASG